MAALIVKAIAKPLLATVGTSIIGSLVTDGVSKLIKGKGLSALDAKRLIQNYKRKDKSRLKRSNIKRKLKSRKYSKRKRRTLGYE